MLLFLLKVLKVSTLERFGNGPERCWEGLDGASQPPEICLRRGSAKEGPVEPVEPFAAPKDYKPDTCAPHLPGLLRSPPSHSQGCGGARASDAMQKEFTTINKDGKTVWEPGLPATVTARRQHRPQKGAPVVDEVPVTCDLRLTLKMPGSSKAEWLEKALKAMPGKAKVQDVFNIITHPKFSSGVAEKYGKRMLQTVAESMDLFSDKQRITLSRCKLVELFQPGGAGEARDDDSGDETPPEAPKMKKRRKRSRSRSQKRRSPSPAKKPAMQNAVSPSRGRAVSRDAGRPDISKSREADEEEDPDWKERYRKQEEEKRRAEAEKKVQQDREAKRKDISEVAEEDVIVAAVLLMVIV
ncbi:hypothetical protein AK812_SmicGene45038 [Symbiodinium microadriaticum]|uniref:Uncharacterized protein n=2 Tax=Symbiodinium TaxID=2949 RepID=A0A1Q9BX21_SYMMI|nr:hypothetical protein AK812_SmicGene45038 [Symbiodinium microadriaticum]